MGRRLCRVKSGDLPSSDIDTNLPGNLPESSFVDAAGINEVLLIIYGQKFFQAATLFSLATLSVTSVAASGHDKVKRENKDSIVTLNDFHVVGKKIQQTKIFAVWCR